MAIHVLDCLIHFYEKKMKMNALGLIKKMFVSGNGLKKN